MPGSTRNYPANSVVDWVDNRHVTFHHDVAVTRKFRSASQSLFWEGKELNVAWDLGPESETDAQIRPDLILRGSSIHTPHLFGGEGKRRPVRRLRAGLLDR